MKVRPLFGAGIAGSSYPVTRQRRKNVYFENRPDGDKTKIACFGTPGLQLVSNAIMGAYTLPIRGMGAAANNNPAFVTGIGSYIYFCSGNLLGAINVTNGKGVGFGGTLSTSSGNISMAASGSQVVIVDGTGAYFLNVVLISPVAPINSTNAVNQSETFGFPYGAKTVTFVSGRFVVEKPNSQQFFVSDLFDGTSWNVLAFASASQYPDLLIAVDSLNGNLVLFSTSHTEFWQDVGGIPEPFAPILSATVEYGLAAIWSRAHLENSLIALCFNRQGTAQVVQFSGYQTKVISTPDLEFLIGTFPSDIENATALTYSINGHSMYQLTFPIADTGVGRSFLYDCSTTLWSETQTGTTPQAATRHIGQFSASAGGVNYISDYATPKLYTVSPTQYTDNGAVIEREIITRHVEQDFNVMSVDEVYLDMETGVGLISGQGSTPQVMLQVSKDNGRTWQTERWASPGQIGQYLTRVVWRQFGSGRDFTFRIRMTDPVKFVITEGAMSVRERQQ